MSMRVSIITVVLNGVETIEHTIKSVLNQEYRDIEYIVIDGGSTDGTREILAKYQGKISRCTSEPDSGIYEAMNKGIKSSTGEAIAILNSDDIYADRTIVGQMVEFIQKNSLDAAYGDLIYVDRNDISRIRRYWRPGPYVNHAFRYGWVIPHPTFFCRREIFDRFGYFNEQLRIAADFDLMLRFIEKHRIEIGYLPKLVTQMRTAGKANVWRGILRGNWEIIKSFHRNGVPLSPWFFARKPIVKISQLFVRPSCDEQ